jgi:hypothetical protein
MIFITYAKKLAAVSSLSSFLYTSRGLYSNSIIQNSSGQGQNHTFTSGALSICTPLFAVDIMTSTSKRRKKEEKGSCSSHPAAVAQ